MDDLFFDDVTENLLYVSRLIHNKIINVDFTEVNRALTVRHVIVMVELKEKDSLPVSEIGKRTLIPKPQMTYLVNKLIELGLVEREFDVRDRRIINLALTEQGRKTLEECHRLIRENVKRKLSYLGDGALQELSELLTKLRIIEDTPE